MATGSPPRNEEEEGRRAAIAFVWTMVAFKVLTMVVILLQTQSANSLIFLAATFWYWLPFIGFLVAAPIAFRYRLLRMRRRRRDLQRSEWMVDTDAAEQDITAGSIRRSGDDSGSAGTTR